MSDETEQYKLMGCGFSSAPMGIQTADGEWVMRASSMYRDRTEQMLKDANEAPALRVEVERLSRTRSVATAGAYAEQNAALRAELARRSDVMDQWWEDHKRITDRLRSEIAEMRAAVLEEATRRRNTRARYTEDEFDRGAFNEAEGMLAWVEGREPEPRHWEDRDEWVTRYDV